MKEKPHWFFALSLPLSHTHKHTHTHTYAHKGDEGASLVFYSLSPSLALSHTHTNTRTHTHTYTHKGDQGEASFVLYSRWQRFALPRVRYRYVCCSVLQCVTVCCILEFANFCFFALPRVRDRYVCCSVLQCVAACCTLEFANFCFLCATACALQVCVLQRVAVPCSVLQCVVVLEFAFFF